MAAIDLSKLITDAEACVRCALCLSVCPTYRETGLEIQSPRGRVLLYAAYAAGELSDPAPVRAAAYDCLDCRACQTICPAGVRPGEAALDVRAILQDGRPQGRVTALALGFFRHPILIDLANLLLLSYQRLGLQRMARGTQLLKRLGFPKLQFAESLLPAKPVALALRLAFPRRLAAVGESKGTVAFFLGCVMNLVFSEVSRSSVEVIRHAGFDVEIPRKTTCCGAPHIEEGDMEGFEHLAKRNIELYAALSAEYIVTDCAACAAELKKYAEYFVDDPFFGPLAAAVSRRTLLFSEFLRKSDLPQVRFPFTTTHQHACHACHAQGVKEEPEGVLGFLSEYRPMQGATDCCGSAGVYNLTHTESSMRILEGKMAEAERTGAQVLTVENPGCLLQLGLGRRLYAPDVEVRHLSQVVWEAMRKGDSTPTG